MIAGVVSYMLLCWGVVFAGLVSLTSSPCSQQGGGLSASRVLLCVCVCLCLAHLVFYGRENKFVKCRNGRNG